MFKNKTQHLSDDQKIMLNLFFNLKSELEHITFEQNRFVKLGIHLTEEELTMFTNTLSVCQKINKEIEESYDANIGDLSWIEDHKLRL